MPTTDVSKHSWVYSPKEWQQDRWQCHKCKFVQYNEEYQSNAPTRHRGVIYTCDELIAIAVMEG